MKARVIFLSTFGSMFVLNLNNNTQQYFTILCTNLLSKMYIL